MQPLKKAFSWCWNHFEKLAAIGWGIVSFGVPAWAVRAADLFSTYAPFSWVAAGFLGLLLGVLIWAVIARTRLWTSMRLAQEVWTRAADRINPLEQTFRNQRINIDDLVSPIERIIRQKTFIDCEIIGPANVVLIGNGSMNSVHFVDCEAVKVSDAARIKNVMAFDGCHFLRGKVFRLTLFTPESAFERFRAEMPGINWLTPE